jgi:hypothetical protein
LLLLMIWIVPLAGGLTVLSVNVKAHLPFVGPGVIVQMP